MFKNRKRGKRLVSWSFLIYSGFICVSSIHAQIDNIVDRTDDAMIATCTAAPNDCTLRGAISNIQSAGFWVQFDPSIFSSPQTISLTLGELELLPGSFVSQIEGPGVNLLTISGNNTSRVLSNFNTVGALIRNLRIANGNGVGAINSGLGGGIYNEGALTLQNVAVDNNHTPAGVGGGVYNLGQILDIRESVLSRNTAGTGGGAFNNGNNLQFVASTISGNSASSSGGGVANGMGSLFLLDSTVCNNSATTAGGGASSGGSVFLARNSIFANNTDGGFGPDIFGSVQSGGYNLIEDITGTTIINPQEEITGLDPNLGPLQPNGGQTETHAPLPGSLAIDSGSSGGFLDQRGLMRPIDDPNTPNPVPQPGNLGDRGAFEVQAPTAAEVSISGRVLSPLGIGIPNAIVQMTGQNGEVLTARSTHFGYYKIENIEAGQTVVFNVFAKQYVFQPQVLNILDNMKSQDFIAQ